MTEYRPIYNSSGELINKTEFDNITNILEALADSGFIFVHLDGYSIILRHGRQVSGHVKSENFTSFLLGLVCGMAQPSKYQECVKAFLVEHE